MIKRNFLLAILISILMFVSAVPVNQLTTVSAKSIENGIAQTDTCITSEKSWKNSTFTAQTGKFTASFVAKPSRDNIDSVTGLSAGSARDYKDLAVIVRFYTNGLIEARDGSVYRSVNQVSYTANVNYTFRLVVDIPNHIYDVFVTPEGGTELVVGTGFAFRTEQSSVASLDNLGIKRAKVGTHTLCNFNIANEQIGWTTDEGVTDSSGNVPFLDRAANTQVIVQVRDAAGNPVPSANILFVGDGSKARAFLFNQNYQPAWAEVQYPAAQSIEPQALPAVVGLVLLAYAGFTIGWNLAELANDPPRIDIELGYTRVCLTYDQFLNLAETGFSVLDLHSLGARKITWVMVGKAGAQEAVFKSAQWIHDATGKQWPWQGEWCFRQSWLPGTTLWLVPETDTIQHSMFRVRLSWDTASTDVDLHVVDSLGNRAYYGSLQGVPGGMLDRDDRDGWGPEIYQQFSTAGASYYDIGVHYYTDNGFGPTAAEVEVFNQYDQAIGYYRHTIYTQNWWPILRIYSDGSIAPIPTTQSATTPALPDAVKPPVDESEEEGSQ